MNITKDVLKKLIKEELNNLAEQTEPHRKWLEDKYVKPYLDKGYIRYDALPRWMGLVAGQTYPAVHSGCTITIESHNIVLVLDGDMSCIRGRTDVMWRVDEKEFNKLAGTDDVYAVLAPFQGTRTTPESDMTDPLEEMIREELIKEEYTAYPEYEGQSPIEWMGDKLAGGAEASDQQREDELVGTFSSTLEMERDVTRMLDNIKTMFVNLPSYSKKASERGQASLGARTQNQIKAIHDNLKSKIDRGLKRTARPPTEI